MKIAHTNAFNLQFCWATKKKNRIRKVYLSIERVYRQKNENIPQNHRVLHCSSSKRRGCGKAKKKGFPSFE